MLTLYELKQNSCFRCLYKSPYYVKNAFLMMLMAVMLLVIYLIYFRADGGSYASMIKIIKGLNSNTFNYLESNSNLLLVDKNMPSYSANKMPTTLEFFSDCVRYNRPCELKGLAKDWPATAKWAENNKGAEYLINKLGDSQIVNTFTKSVNLDGKIETRKFSFRSDFSRGMSYSEFLSAQA